MKISVTSAQTLIHTLQAGVDGAMAKGEHEFEFVAALQADDDAARAELVSAIEKSQATTAARQAAETQSVGEADVGSVEAVLGNAD